MNASEYYQAGQLKEAVAAAIEDVKKNPSDSARRGLLCQLQCFAGEYDKADNQLDTVAHQKPDAMMGVLTLRQLVRAEKSRQEFYISGRAPEFVSEPSDCLKLHLQAAIAIREGRAAEAEQLLAQAEEIRPHVGGTCDGERFDDIRDIDDLTAPFLEVLTTNGKYYWVPFESIVDMTLEKPEKPIDLLWRRVQMTVRGGPDGQVYLPTIYFGSSKEEDDRIKLGRVTDWTGGEGSPVRGIGQRTLLIGEQDLPLLSIKEIIFDTPEGAESEEEE